MFSVEATKDVQLVETEMLSKATPETSGSFASGLPGGAKPKPKNTMIPLTQITNGGGGDVVTETETDNGGDGRTFTPKKNPRSVRQEKNYSSDQGRPPANQDDNSQRNSMITIVVILLVLAVIGFIAYRRRKKKRA